MREPEAGTVERWAWDYVLSSSLAHKRAPPPPPERWEEAPEERRIPAPGRPPELRVLARAEKTRGLGSAAGRAHATHTFVHHELQAAELMAWAILAFPRAPRAFREGLLRMALDEVRHLNLYAEHVERLGHHVGEFAVRDWFWQRVPTAATPTAFVAIMGLGLESANLEHARTWAGKLRAAGDELGARAQEVVGFEEIAHVRFGVRWFEAFERALDFDAWRRALPAPLTPLLMRGATIARDARLRAGQPAAFIDELEAWKPDPPGS